MLRTVLYTELWNRLLWGHKHLRMGIKVALILFPFFLQKVFYKELHPYKGYWWIKPNVWVNIWSATFLPIPKGMHSEWAKVSQ